MNSVGRRFGGERRDPTAALLGESQFDRFLSYLQAHAQFLSCGHNLFFSFHSFFDEL